MRIVYHWIALFFLLAFVACNTTTYEEPDIIVTLDPEFTVDLYEQRDPADGGAEFGLWVESMAIFDCSNFQVAARVSVDAAAISVELLDIKAPALCQGGPDKARGFVPIGALADGTYDFTFALSTLLESTGTLTVQNGRYQLDLPQQKGIDFQNRMLETMPTGYVWGFADTLAEQDLPRADQLIQDLKNQTEAPKLPAGFYSYFTVSATGQYFFHRSMAPLGQHRPFLRRLGPGGASTVGALLQSYRNDPVRPLSIRCLSTQGAL